MNCLNLKAPCVENSKINRWVYLYCRGYKTLHKVYLSKKLRHWLLFYFIWDNLYQEALIKSMFLQNTSGETSEFQAKFDAQPNNGFCRLFWVYSISIVSHVKHIQCGDFIKHLFSTEMAHSIQLISQNFRNGVSVIIRGPTFLIFVFTEQR